MTGDFSQLDADEKRAALASILRQQGVQSHFPLSFAQQRLWQIQQLDPESPVFNISVAYRLDGPLDEAALQRALQQTVLKHESLRTTFQVRGTHPVQVVSGSYSVRLDTIPRYSDSMEPWPADIKRLAEKEAAIPFNLAQGPLWRFKLIRYGNERHVLFITLHHLIADRWSLGVLAKDVSLLYAEPGTTAAPRDSSTEYTYRDSMAAQMEREYQERLVTQTAWWEANLKRAQPLRLPHERTSPHGRSQRGERHVFECDAAVTNSLVALCERERCTLYIALLTAFSALIFQQTGQDDQLVCAPVAGRHRTSTKNVMGYFNNILPIRIRLKRDATLREMLRTVSQATRSAFEHQDVPFQQIAGLTEVLATPLSRCLFSLQNTHSLAWRLPGITSDYLDIPNGTSDFDLAVFLEQRNEELLGIVDFKTDVFDAAAIVDVCESYRAALRRWSTTRTRGASRRSIRRYVRRSHPSLAHNHRIQSPPTKKPWATRFPKQNWSCAC